MSEQQVVARESNAGGRSGGARTTLAGVAAVGSVLAASTCCLPLLPMLLAAGFAGTSEFFSAARPYLLAASVLFVAYGFYAAWRAKQCRRRTNRVSLALLWCSAGFVIVSIFFPQAMANLSASLLPR